MFSSAGEDPDREKARTKWWMKKDEYKKIPVTLLPVRQLDEIYKWCGAIRTNIQQNLSRLLEFGVKKGFDYDQILDSKPGISIAGEIETLYKNEMGSSSFEKMLKNRLDETLVKNISTIENEQDLNIEDTLNLAYREFNKYLSGKASRLTCPTPG